MVIIWNSVAIYRVISWCSAKVVIYVCFTKMSRSWKLQQLSHVFLVKKGLLVLLLGVVSISTSFQEVLKCKHLHQSYFSHTLTVVKMSIQAVIVLHSRAKKYSKSAIFLSEAENFLNTGTFIQQLVGLLFLKMYNCYFPQKSHCYCYC